MKFFYEHIVFAPAALANLFAYSHPEYIKLCHPELVSGSHHHQTERSTGTCKNNMLIEFTTQILQVNAKLYRVYFLTLFYTIPNVFANYLASS